MNILVLIKQVPESETTTEISSDGTDIVRSPALTYKMNRFDEYALEEAMRIKDEFPETEVDVISLGPERAKEVIRRAYGIGADEGFHLLQENGSNYSDPYVVSKQIAEQAKKKHYDLILAGVMSEDLMQSQTGQMVAEFADLPCVSSVIELALEKDEKRVHLKQELEGGVRHKITADLPCVLTIQAGINTPRYPSLSKVLKATDKEIQTIKTAVDDATQSCASIKLPTKQRAGEVLKGGREEKVRELDRILRQKNILM